MVGRSDGLVGMGCGSVDGGAGVGAVERFLSVRIWDMQ
jgi:hypothetical protein